MEDMMIPNGNVDYVVELLAGLVEEGRPPTREQIREHCESLCRAQVRKIDYVVLGRLEAGLSDTIEACRNDTTHSGRIIHDAMTMRCQVREIRQTLHAAGEGK